MGRPSLSQRRSSVTEQIRLPEDVADLFRIECEKAGEPRSAVLRKLVEKWLRKRRAIERERAKIA